MSTRRPVRRDDALEDISTWRTGDVVDLLRKNGLEEACWRAAEKRQIDGDELLHLTEGKLALWKSELSRPLRRHLWEFVEAVKQSPEKYVEQCRQQQGKDEQQAQDQPQQRGAEREAETASAAHTESDASPWDTDFEDDYDEPEETRASEPRYPSHVDLDFRNSLRKFLENGRANMLLQSSELKASSFSLESRTESFAGVPENTYANSEANEETTYANCGWPEDQTEDGCTYANEPAQQQQQQPRPNASKLHGTTEQLQSSLAEELRAQLALIGVKPALAPKNSEALIARRDEITPRASEYNVPRSSFLHKNPQTNGTAQRPINGVNGHASKTSPSGSIAARSTSSSARSSRPQSSSEESLRNLPKPPAAIRSFDLVANLPTARAACDSDEEEEEEEEEEEPVQYEASYEAFDQPLVEHSRARTPSVHSTEPATYNSPESIYRPPSSQRNRDDDEVYELYESIKESPEDHEADNNEMNGSNSPPKVPPPLPAQPPRGLSGSKTQLNKPDVKTERSLERKSATLPSHGSSGNATRPLPPPPPKRQSYYDRPWFHNLTREQANRLIEERCTRGNPLDGYFLIRPSTAKPENPMTLVLWYKDKVYNIPVRRRPDNRYALGTPKDKERFFESIDDIVPFFKSEDLVLSSGGQEQGKTKLTETPPKQ